MLKKHYNGLFLIILIVLLNFVNAASPPELPMIVSGEVYINNRPARVGTEITAKIDSALVEQAVLNLIDNAIKYSQENSKIQVSAQKIGNEVLIKVSDQGCGIEKEHLDRIFERFYVVDKGRSRKLGGTGLGLSIVKHIAQVHGGVVAVESRVGSGSIFTIRLPSK